MDSLTFLERLDKAKPQALYVLHGDDAFLKRQVQQAIRLLVLGPEENTFALMTQAFNHGRNRRLLFLYRRDPTEADSKCDEVRAHCGFRLRSDPPRRPVVTAMTLGKSSS